MKEWSTRGINYLMRQKGKGYDRCTQIKRGFCFQSVRQRMYTLASDGKRLNAMISKQSNLKIKICLVFLFVRAQQENESRVTRLYFFFFISTPFLPTIPRRIIIKSNKKLNKVWMISWVDSWKHFSSVFLIFSSFFLLSSLLTSRAG